jgi:hypothetical protein
MTLLTLFVVAAFLVYLGEYKSAVIFVFLGVFIDLLERGDKARREEEKYGGKKEGGKE